MPQYEPEKKKVGRPLKNPPPEPIDFTGLIEKYGRREVARKMMVTPGMVHYWVHHPEGISPDKCVKMELVFRGEVTRKSLRPDIFGDLRYKPWYEMNKPENLHEPEKEQKSVSESDKTMEEFAKRMKNVIDDFLVADDNDDA